MPNLPELFITLENRQREREGNPLHHGKLGVGQKQPRGENVHENWTFSWHEQRAAAS